MRLLNLKRLFVSCIALLALPAAAADVAAYHDQHVDAAELEAAFATMAPICVLPCCRSPTRRAISPPIC